MLRRLGIRAKVLAVLAVPMLVLLGAGVYVSYNAITDYRYAAASKVAISSGKQLIDYTDALTAERIAALTGADDATLKQAEAATDAAYQEWSDAAAGVDQSQFPASVGTALTNALKAGPANAKTARLLPADKTRQDEAYSAAIQPQMQVGQAFANALKDRDAAAYLQGINALGTLSNNLVTELIAGVELPLSVAPLQEGQQYAALAASTELARTAARGALYTLDSGDLVLPSGDPDNNLLNWRQQLTAGNPATFARVDFGGYAKDIQRQLGSFDALQKTALTSDIGQASKSAQDARDRALITILIALLAAAASFLVALTVSRAIVNPLRRLTRAAAEVRDELPRLVEQVAVPGEGPEIRLDPIPVRSRDEVGRLAEAFNAVNATTVQVAQEQAALRGSIAEMFVNVARRDQVLLNRQLAFIDSLERAEEDPSTLANLFRLDHLATRMRRNAESLLVLAGIDTGRRLRDTMPLSDVVRTASSEIEQYDRVELDLQVDPPMLGFNALAAAHLLAELLENATIFSEPETPVTVTTGVSGPFVVVRVLDQGLGMTDAEIDAANAKIVSTGAGDALGAQRLGLFVVGRISQRLGAEVRLMKSTRGTGTETVVRFPATLFATTESSPYGAAPGVSAIGPSTAAPVDEIEAPVFTEVDLSALTDGQTSQGLPRRRRGEDEDTSSGEIPLPAVAEAPAPSAGLPTRPRKTFDENNIVLPEAPAPVLPTDFGSVANEWTPAVVAPTAGGLPSRSRASTAAWHTPETESPAAAAPATPSARAGLFSGFRGRGDIESDTTEAAPAEDANRLHAPWMQLGGAHAAQPAPMVVPGLAPDEWDQADGAAPATDPDSADAGVWVPTFADDAAVAAPQQDEPWSPTFAAEAATVAETAEPAWAPPQPVAQEEPVWAPAEPVAQDEPVWAPAEPVAQDEPVWAPAEPVAQDEPVWAPAEPVAQAEPVWAPAEPVEQAEPAWAQSFVAPVADEPWAPVAQDEPVWAPAEPVAQDEPVWAPAEPVAQQEPVWAPAEPVAQDEPVWAPAEPVMQDESAWAPSFAVPEHDEPAWTPSFGQVEPLAQAEPVVTHEEPEPAWAPTFAAEPSSLASRRPAAEEEPAVEAAVAEAEPVPAEAPVEPSVPQSFTGYSGYAGWAGATQRAVGGAPLTGDAFRRTLDEARAWHTGAIPVVQHGADARAAEAASASIPVAAAPVVEPVEPIAAAFTDETAWPVPTWETPAWESPTWQQAAPVAAAPVAEPEPEPAAAPVELYAPQVAEQPQPEAQPFVPQLEADPEPVVPAWPSPATAQSDVEAPTQFFAPAVQEAPAPVAPEPAYPAWSATAPAPTAQAPQAFESLVSSAPAAAEQPAKKKRFGLFSRRKDDEQQAETYTPTPPAPEASLPVRTSAWTAEAPAAPAWQQPAPVQPAPDAASFAPPVRTPAPAPAPSPAPSAGSWSPPEWSAGPARQPALSEVPQPSLPPSTAPRIGTLDDEVAAMLALRSDIQEQALAELSQLSTYRPAAVRQSERLTKRVPTAIPAAEPIADAATAAPRDAEQLRSRLSSFQSGSQRGRRAVDQPQDGQS